MRDHWEYKMLVGSIGMQPHWVDADDTAIAGDKEVAGEGLDAIGLGDRAISVEHLGPQAGRHASFDAGRAGTLRLGGLSSGQEDR